MITYHKINTIFKRDPETNHKNLLIGQYSTPELEMLKDINWLWDEKIDGTNIRVIFERVYAPMGGVGYEFDIRGKTDAAQIPPMLNEFLTNHFDIDLMDKVFPESDSNTPITLYGEGYGAKIQKVGKDYLYDSNSFILFDVKVGRWWLSRESVEDISGQLGVMNSPEVGNGTLAEAIEATRHGQYSEVAENSTLISEGLVLRPEHELTDRAGRRIITKIKHKDFIGV